MQTRGTKGVISEPKRAAKRTVIRGALRGAT